MFIGLYMTTLLLLIFIKNRKEMFDYPPAKLEPVSVIMPCYNAEKTIGPAIESILNLDYPKEMIEIIVVDDKSRDDSVKVVEGYVKKYDNVRLIKHSKNCGNAAGTTNTGIKYAKYDYIAVADDDSTPDRDALKKMIGFLQKERDVGGVTCAVLARDPKTFMQRLQAIEYAVIAWSRKLLDFVDAVYVTPGPFALYKKKVLVEVGLFDTKNMTQDIEIVWRMLAHGYKARMSLATRVYSETPNKFMRWFRQRIRWNIGGKQCIWKYRNLFFKRGMLGAFILPFFTLSLFLGLFGLGIFGYLFARRFLVSYFMTRYAVYASSSVLYLQDLTFSPSILNFFGAALFFLGMFFTIFGLRTVRLQKSHWGNIFNFLFYSLVYLTVYPLLLIISTYRVLVGDYRW